MTTTLDTRSRQTTSQRWTALINGKKLQRIIAPAVAITSVLVLWQLLCSLPGATLPTPTQVVSDTWELIVNPFYQGTGTNKGLFWQIAASLQRVAIGYTAAAIVGVALGILIGVNRLFYAGLDPLVQVFRTIPPLAWLPISLAAIQKSELAALFVIFITAIWPILINTAVGVQRIPADYNNVARVLKLPKLKYFFKILLPASLPYIFTGLRLGIGLSWLAIVAAEMLIGGVGIGFFIWDAYNSAKVSDIILALLYVGLVGLLLDKLVGFAGSLIVPAERK
ncbi:nitrate ABC transporter permease [Gloeobacter kilaueensis]|uniref:Nitrate ABC transporter inner membrane subunit n=1 Tax=Gloeobacter kilaueensis (strain ATCC BAA-2537 / CCAP 1431/1 / ULC 316 / JS1) TaxID=1183438 RepID=U5QNF5_GLOK1|nr:nitrate ABC transporter permease [Gloeobacter kilaueensis]AGY60456.1 nitrate ABC transporter inner membrane subunit [Gloeobacter kilaueensis JS1]